MDLSIIIVNYNVYDDVKKCIKSIKDNNRELSYEIILVDNDSHNRSVESISADYPDVVYLELDENKGFGSANNAGMKIAKGCYLLLVNPDIIFNDNSVEKMLDYMKSNSKVGVCGPIQSKPNEGIEYYYTFFPSLYSRITQEFGLYWHAPFMKNRYFDFLNENIAKGLPFKVDWIIGSCMMTRKEIFENLGGFDEAFFLYEEEVEWQYRMNQYGWISMMLPQLKVLHNHHSSTSKLGQVFVHYQEYRSRILFSVKRYGFPVLFLRRLLTIDSILFRLFWFTILNFRSMEVSSKRFFLYFDLIKLILKPKQKVLQNRFCFDDYKELFRGTVDAKF